ncbi:hypothetical protein [Rhizobium altiplani]|uniref:hypothetical protein n=1 Tax=Rhizobium altiplani TaxID=1864509 RepID=UPI000B08FDB6|nr:hypothetical protein [Rhizobium altiplani]
MTFSDLKSESKSHSRSGWNAGANRQGVDGVPPGFGRTNLLPAWQNGDATAAQAAMGKFLDEYQEE